MPGEARPLGLKPVRPQRHPKAKQVRATLPVGLVVADDAGRSWSGS